MDNRDMYYGYGGYTPMFSYGQQVPVNTGNASNLNIPNNYTNSIFNDMINRVERLERQVKRLDQKLTRLEAPYSTNTNNNEDDNDMYIM